MTEAGAIDRVLDHLLRTQASPRRQRAPPTRYKGFMVVALIVATTEDELGQHKVSIRLVRPNGKYAAEAGGSLTLKATS